MLLSVGHFLFVFLVGSVILGVLGAAVFLCAQYGHVILQIVPIVRRTADDKQRPCLYCFLGRANLHETKVVVESDELVEVRCFVCRSCGIPHWTVARSPVLKKAA